MAGSRTRPRVLVVEDEALIAMGLETTLAGAGWEVVGPVGSLRRAVRAAADEEALDAALLDVNLAGEASFPAAELLAARGVPVVFMTGYGAGDIPERLRARPVLRKPAAKRALLAALAAASGRGPERP